MFGVRRLPTTWMRGISGAPRWDIPKNGWGKETANGWRSIGLDKLVFEVDQFNSSIYEGEAEIHVEMSVHANNGETGFKVLTQYSITGIGEIEISTFVSPRGKMSRWLPKVGLQLELPIEFQHVEWFGRGPFETYPDRKTGAKVGRYNTTVEKDFVPYIIPQDYGNKADVHWISVTDDTGDGMLIDGGQTFNTSVQKYTTENMDRAYYPFQLKDEKVITLNLDHQVSGVGGTANSILKPYRVLPNEYTFTFTICPLRD